MHCGYLLLTIKSKTEMLSEFETIVQDVVHKWEDGYKLLEKFHVGSEKEFLVTHILEYFCLVMLDLLISHMSNILCLFEVSNLFLFIRIFWH